MLLRTNMGSPLGWIGGKCFPKADADTQLTELVAKGSPPDLRSEAERGCVERG
jgi:hypothetical protein